MRPIDADALKEKFAEILESTYTDDYAKGFVNGLCAALNMPTLTPPNEWVSVEDRLPAENESVLCITNGKPRENITLIATYQIGSWNATEGWIIDEWPDWEDAEVSWWMTIPEPPERRPPEGEEET